jgi:hypothetical protein
VKFARSIDFREFSRILWCKSSRRRSSRNDRDRSRGWAGLIRRRYHPGS